MKKTLISLLTVTVLALYSCAAGQPEAEPFIETGISGIDKSGTVLLDVTPDEMKKRGFEPADVVSAEIGDLKMTMPVGTEYSDVDSGKPVCRIKSGTAGGDQVALAVNLGNFASSAGIAEIRGTDAEPGFEVVWADGYGESSTVRLSLVQKQGYADGYVMHKLLNSRTNERSDYPALTDAEYANFREVATTGMGKGTLYRSSSPVNPCNNRNKEADAALAAAGIKTVVNLADSGETVKAYPGYASTRYSKCTVITLNMGFDFSKDENREKLAEGFRFIARNEGPYLIHCTEGKDRTGFALGVLESLMGASAGEVISDYMTTYKNFYGITPGTVQYGQIADGNIKTSLSKAFGVTAVDGEGVVLAECAQEYLKGLGLSGAEIDALKNNLGKDNG